MNETTDIQQPHHYHLVRDRKKRVIKPPKRFGDADMIPFEFSVAYDIYEDEPASIHEAMSSKKKYQMLQAMKEELESLNKNITWELVPKPEG